MRFGKLDFNDATKHRELVAQVTNEAVEKYDLNDALVSEIDASLADTTAFCDAYDIGLDVSANCVVVEAKRADKTWYAACLILATNRADINGVVRRHLDARKISFAPMDIATSLTKMEYGGITPIGLPDDWQLIVDEAITQKEHVIIGSGIRGSKLLVPSSIFNNLPNTTILDIAKKEQG
ncbi:MAG TPA: YbaK/EbsC family protein [Candidatus Saccharibacteria bacterium]|jgi:prolyl-tRNA editing enzyme YbaK/EbsC (Cys-tRNA(Pro) deacylase)|nr:YbaK/EbsC family protein [Candidatus Saccharibacteria bacterium]